MLVFAIFTVLFFKVLRCRSDRKAAYVRNCLLSVNNAAG